MKHLLMALFCFFASSQATAAATCPTLNATKKTDLQTTLEVLAKPRKPKEIVKKADASFTTYTADIELAVSQLAQNHMCSDYMDWKKKHPDILDKPEGIQKFSLEDIQLLITTIVRGERMSSGLVGTAIEKGAFTQIQTRLKKLTDKKSDKK